MADATLEEALAALSEFVPGALEEALAAATDAEITEATAAAVAEALGGANGLSVDVVERFEGLEELSLTDVNETGDGYVARVDGDVTEDVLTTLANVDPRHAVADVSDTEDGDRAVEVVEREGSLGGTDGLVTAVSGLFALETSEELLDADVADVVSDDAFDFDEDEDEDDEGDEEDEDDGDDDGIGHDGA